MKQLDIGVVREILMAMPDVQESTIHGYPSFKTGGKLLACPAIHKSVEANSLVVKLPVSERDRLLAEHPRKYYLTDHYARNSVVLVRLAEVDRKSLCSLLEHSRNLLNASRRDQGARSTKPALSPRSASPKRKRPTKRSSRSRV